jgi:tRNA(Arg) A34 adenosine deaminase TadA
VFPAFELSLPDWVAGFCAEAGAGRFPDERARMEFAIELSRRNVRAGTGGPFGAAVFDTHTHTLVAPGVNLVTRAKCSSAHAEIVALTIAQRAVEDYDLGSGWRRLELVTSTEPCAMCFGAIGWSGVVRLLCGARDEDARAIGFDEGPKVADWPGELRARGIEVVRDVCRADAAAVLTEYVRAGGELYNARKGQ